MMPTLSVIPSTMLSTTLGTLLGPISAVAVAAALIACAVMVGGLLVERRDGGYVRAIASVGRARRASASIAPLTKDAA
jgi:hypothetical protein